MCNNIEIIEGDLLTTDANIICHQVNNKGAMNSGVAKQIRNKYPTVYDMYISSFKKDGLKLGECQIIIVGDKQYICNLVGQDGYGYDGKQYTDYQALKKGFYSIRDFMMRNNLKTIAFPYNIGCCRGGGDWNIVYELIKEVFSDFIALSHNIEIKIYKLDLK